MYVPDDPLFLGGGGGGGGDGDFGAVAFRFGVGAGGGGSLTLFRRPQNGMLLFLLFTEFEDSASWEGCDGVGAAGIGLTGGRDERGC